MRLQPGTPTNILVFDALCASLSPGMLSDRRRSVSSPPQRVLLLAPYFLPRRRVGSMRPFRFAIHLREFGWEPVVMTIDFPGGRLTDKEAHLLKDIRVLRVASPVDRTERSESQLGAAAGKKRGAPASWASALDRQFPVDAWLPFFAAKFGTMLRLAREVDPGVVWATGDPWSGLVAGRWLSKRLGVPYIADFRDPWTLSEARSRRKWGWVQRIDRRAERRVAAEADMLMFQTRRVADAYRELYAEFAPSSVVIGNSFDPDVFSDPVVMEGNAPGQDAAGIPARASVLRIGFFGRFRELSPATPALDVLTELQRSHPALAGRAYVHSFGPLSGPDAARARARGLEGQFVREDAVPLEQALSALRRFDILLVSTDMRRHHIIPAKIFEYLAAGRPILSLSPNPEVGEMLRRTGTGEQLQDPAAGARLLAECIHARAAGRPLPIAFRPNPEEIMRHDARTTTRAFARALDALTSR